MFRPTIMTEGQEGDLQPITKCRECREKSANLLSIAATNLS